MLRRAPQLNTRLRGAFRSLNRLVERPSTGSALSRLDDLFDEARPLAGKVAAAQTVCNYWNYWFTFLPEHLSDRDQVGFTQRVAIIGFPMGNVTIDSQANPRCRRPRSRSPARSKPRLPDTPGWRRTGRPARCSTRRREGVPALRAPDPPQPGLPAGRPAQGRLPVRADRLPARRPPRPRPTPDSPALIASDYPGSRGPTTLFYNRDRNRALVDTRVPGRQPNR